MLPVNTVVQGDALEVLRTFPSGCVDMAITSPPYWALRDYGMDGQIGLEPDFRGYITKLCEVFAEAKRVLKDAGTCWVNLGDTYGTGSGAGVRKGLQATNRGTQSNKGWQENGKQCVRGFEKSLLQIPARFAIAMTERGWILRNEIIWQKPNCMPSSARDRFTVDFEKLFFFVKSSRYHFDQQFEPFAANSDVAYRARLRNGKTYRSKAPYQANLPGSFDPRGRNQRCVWRIPTRPCHQAHTAIFPPELLEVPIMAGCPEGGIVLDPFLGSGTTALAALKLDRKFVGIELNPAYVEMARQRIAGQLSRACLAA
jgi:DNA modification methylase